MATKKTKPVKSKGGRPRKFKSPEEFDAKVAEYVEHCKTKEEPMTWTGMALYLGFSSRQGVDDYLRYDGFFDSVKKAKAIVEEAYEKRLSGNNPTGAIFALKNFGWQDKRQVESAVRVDGQLTLADVLSGENGES